MKLRRGSIGPAAGQHKTAPIGGLGGGNAAIGSLGGVGGAGGAGGVHAETGAKEEEGEEEDGPSLFGGEPKL